MYVRMLLCATAVMYRYKSTYDQYSGVTTLTIYNLREEDEGEYTCKAINSLGEASTSATLLSQGLLLLAARLPNCGEPRRKCRRVLNSQHHLLDSLLADKNSHGYDLRRRRHDRILSHNDDLRNFVHRQIH